MKNTAKLYAIVTQCLFTILALILIGFLIGYYAIDKHSIWSGILATLGGIIGIINFIVTMYKMSGDDSGTK